MEKKRIEVVKSWSKPKPVRDILVFLGFINFYRRFIKNFNRIATLLPLILRTTSVDDLSTYIYNNEKSQDIPCDTSSNSSGISISKSIKNLSTIVNLAKSKKSDLAEFKKSDLPKANFTKDNSSGTDFHTLKPKRHSSTFEKLLLRL